MVKNIFKMSVIANILSERLDQDITEIIMTNLWKLRFNKTVNEIDEITSYIDQKANWDAHIITVREKDKNYQISFCYYFDSVGGGYQSEKVYRSIRTCCNVDFVSITTDDFYNSNNSSRNVFFSITYEGKIHQFRELYNRMSVEDCEMYIYFFKFYMICMEIFDDVNTDDEAKKYWRKKLEKMFKYLRGEEHINSKEAIAGKNNINIWNIIALLSLTSAITASMVYYLL